ncbi:toxin-activating lysine-acyltransferase [Herbaspirillum sp. RV1423]|uniref:toxin-activating lysine-acyltransferase n=1 Tax=Herbaspirillum sp. RV1423 TaxID=1443993 RepID=UPI000688AFDE|nr:toxin-activating lysine-acyltransferase [Herbaspirillum sp. RV1423]
MTPTQANDADGKTQQSAIEEAEAALDKLSMLGPVAWLYGRTQDRRFLFMADLDWAVMPPVVLDQCRLFMRGKMPFAFMTWAFVGDEVHARLSQGQGKLAPHEWRSGEHAWLIDVVAPFGGETEILDELAQLKFADRPLVNYLAFSQATRKLEVRSLVPGQKIGSTAETATVPATTPLH